MSDRNEPRRITNAAVTPSAIPERWAEAAQGAAPRAEGLDVDVLANALRITDNHSAGYGAWAEKAAKEYDRMIAASRPSDERVPESEEPR